MEFGSYAHVEYCYKNIVELEFNQRRLNIPYKLLEKEIKKSLRDDVIPQIDLLHSYFEVKNEVEEMQEEIEIARKKWELSSLEYERNNPDC